MNIYVKNLAEILTEEHIREVFSVHGEVSSVIIARDRITGRPRGFGIVEMPNREEGANAIVKLHGFKIGGKNWLLSETKSEQADNRNRGGRE